MRLRRINRPKAAIITAKQRLLIMVEKRGAVKRECARAEGVGSGERKARTAKQPQGPAREHQPSEFTLQGPPYWGSVAPRRTFAAIAQNQKIGSAREKRMEYDFLVNCSTPFLVASRSDATPCQESYDTF